MKRVLAVFLAVVLLFSMAACTKDTDGRSDKEYEYTTGYDETKYNAPGELPVFKDTQTISVMVPDSTMVEDWDTNYQTTMIEEDLNADLVFTVLPSKEYKTKVNLMVAAGGDELTDAILGSFADETVQSYADAEVIAPLTEYFYNTDIAYYIHDSIDRLGWNYFPQITQPDGEIYYVPKLNEAISNVNPDKMWIYEPWLEQLGIDIDKIETRDDFSDALSAIVNGDPNGNGKADECGIVAASTSTGWLNYIMNTFVYAGGDDYMDVNDGKISFAFQTEEWKEGLKYIKGMYDAGLISPLSFSQDSASFKSMLNNETTIVGAFCQTGPGTIDQADQRRVEYEGVQPLNSDANGGKPLASYDAPSATGAFLVKADAADIETAFRFGDYMTSLKVSLNQRFGQEGVDYLLAGENDKSMYDSLGYPAYLIEVLAWSTVQNKHWYQTGPYIREKAISAGSVWSGNPLDHNRVIAEAQIKYEGKNPEEYITKLIYEEEDSDIVAETKAALIEYVDEMNAKFITGAYDIDAQWDSFQDQVEKMGASTVLEAAQTAYDRMNEE